jgi:AcrR family transcriptional regulator
LERECLAALTLRRVAREAGVSQAAPYSHFKDKKALLAAVAIEGFERFDKLMKEYAAKEETYIIGLGMG